MPYYTPAVNNQTEQVDITEILGPDGELVVFVLVKEAKTTCPERLKVLDDMLGGLRRQLQSTVLTDESKIASAGHA